MWAEIEVPEIDGKIYRLRFEERNRKWTGGTLNLRILAERASAGIPAADARLARTAAEEAAKALGGRVIALGEWPWPEDWGIPEEAVREAEKKEIIIR